MSKQDLNGAEIHAGFQQVGGEGVPQQVWMNGLGDTGRTGGFPASRVDSSHRDGLAWTRARK
jgi:hypothetical protein